MKVYTYTEARQGLAELLQRAEKEGEVRIKRRDGSLFIVKPERRQGSPLAVEAVDMELTAEEIVEYIREVRQRS